jgi:MraZ protein
MTFVGEFGQAIDVKNRVTIPAPLRSAAGRTGQSLEFVLVPVPGRYLWMFPAEHMRRIMASPAVPGAPEGASRLAFLAATMWHVQVDARGRVVIPAKMLRLAGLGRDVVMVGAEDHIEIWPREQWVLHRQEASRPPGAEPVERRGAPRSPAAEDSGLGQAGGAG